MLGAPQIDLEDGKDSLVLRCEADANPPASIIWKRAGRSEIASLQVSLLASFHSFSLCVVRLNFKCFCYSGFSVSLFWIGFQWISILSRRDDCSVWCSHAENLLETPHRCKFNSTANAYINICCRFFLFRFICSVLH